MFRRISCSCFLFCFVFFLFFAVGVSGWNKNNTYGCVTMATKVCFTFGFHDRGRRQLRAILYGCKIGREFRVGCKILISIASYVKYNCFCNNNFGDNVTLPVLTFLRVYLTTNQCWHRGWWNHVHILVISTLLISLCCLSRLSLKNRETVDLWQLSYLELKWLGNNRLV